MGGGYSPSRGGWDGGGGGGSPEETYDLVSQREGKTTEVDQVLSVMRDVQDQYGFNLDTHVAKMDKNGANTMAYYTFLASNPDQGVVGVNRTFFDSNKLNSVYDESVKTGFHPSRGNKSGMEATVAHEMGHAITGQIAGKQGGGYNSFERVSSDIMQNAKKKLGYRGKASDIGRTISGYGAKNPSEAIAEAFSDVYCNGRRAKRESRAVVEALNEMYNGG